MSGTAGESKILQGVRRWVQRCNDADTADTVPFVLDDSCVGCLHNSFATLLEGHGVFQEGEWEGRRCITIGAGCSTEAQRTAAVDDVLRRLRQDGHITGWRDELYPVVTRFGAEASLLVERAAAHLFGIKAYGVHMNGFVRRDDGLHLWVATRAASKPTWPGKYDHLAAGGQPHGISVRENLIKEAQEEAGIPRAIAEQAKPVGAVSYTSTGPNGVGIKRDVLFVYDLELPESFVPQAMDGEVESFELRPAHEVLDVVAFSDGYKDNCNLVLADWFVRHGLLEADAPGYLDLVRELRSGDCS